MAENAKTGVKRVNSKIKHSVGEIIFDIINYTVLTLFGLCCLFPVLYEAMMSVSSKADYLASSSTIMIIPRDFNIEAYKFIFAQDRVGKSFFISLFITIVGTAYSMILTCFGAYAFTRKDVPGLKFFFTLIVITMFFSGGLIPFYLTVKSVVGIDNLACLIIPFGINTFNMILLRNFFIQVPDSIVESCRIEGASEFRILLQFVIPLSRAGIATIMLWYLVGKWDDWYWPSFFLNSRDDLYPLAYTLRNTLVKSDGSPAVDPGVQINGEKLFARGREAAMIMIAIGPVLIIYPFMQKYFVKGVMIGGVKG